MAPILTVKAGRAQRRSEDSNWVDPMPAKGKIELEWNDDLLTFGELADECRRQEADLALTLSDLVDTAWKSREASSTDADDVRIPFIKRCKELSTRLTSA